MKTLTAVLIVSLAANVTLAAVALTRGRPTHAQPISAQSGEQPGDRPATPTGPAANPICDGSPLDWSRWRAGGDAAFFARLRAEGFPPAIVRALARRVVADRFAARQQEIERMMDAIPWWRSQSVPAESAPEVRSAWYALSRDMQAAVRELLGEDELCTIDPDTYRRQYGDLPVEKVRRYLDILLDHNELVSEVRSAARGIMLAEDRQRVSDIERARQQEIEALLSPDELIELEMRSGSTASALRSKLLGFNPSEQEYRAIFRLQKEFDAKYGSASSGAMSADDRKLRDAAEAELTAQVAAVLSPERFADYQIAIEPSYRTTAYLLARFDIPQEKTRDLVVLQRDFQARARLVQADTSLDAQGRDAQLAALSTEAATRVGAVLSGEVLAEYRRSTGRWIDTIKRRTGP
jgi:hypothetical protein